MLRHKYISTLKHAEKYDVTKITMGCRIVLFIVRSLYDVSYNCEKSMVFIILHSNSYSK